MKLIGINGFKTSGKDTTYKIIRELILEKVVRRAFADKLKIMAAKALGIEGEDQILIAIMDEFKESGRLHHSYFSNPAVGGDFSLNSPKPEAYRSFRAIEGEITGREYLQNFGAKAREVFGDTFWIDQVLPNPNPHTPDPLWAPGLRRYFGDAKWGCITDVRYANEAERVLALGGEVWEIVRPGIESDGHSSEVPLDRELVTKTILNDSSLDTLKNRVSLALSFYDGRAALNE